MKEKYGMLTPIEPTEKRYNNEVVWKFECDCGAIVYRSLAQVKTNTRLNYICSCGKHPTQNKSEKSREIIKQVTKNGGNISLIKKQQPYKTNKLGIKGVSYDAKREKYIAQLSYKKRYYFLGRYDTPEAAKEAYEKKREEILKQED